MDNNPPSMATLIMGDKTLDVDDDYEEVDLSSESPEILKKKRANNAKKASSGSGSKQKI